MEIKKTKLVRKILLNKNQPYKRSTVMQLRQKKFTKVNKVGNSTVIIHSELCRLTSDERRQWFEEELERGNPVLKDLQKIVLESYNKRMQRVNIK